MVTFSFTYVLMIRIVQKPVCKGITTLIDAESIRAKTTCGSANVLFAFIAWTKFLSMTQTNSGSCVMNRQSRV